MYFMKNSNQLETACRKSLEMLELEFSIYQQSQEYTCTNVYMYVIVAWCKNCVYSDLQRK